MANANPQNPQPQQALTIDWAKVLQLVQMLIQFFASGQPTMKGAQGQAQGKGKVSCDVGCCCDCLDHALHIVACCVESLDNGGCPCPDLPPHLHAQAQALLKP